MTWRVQRTKSPAVSPEPSSTSASGCPDAHQNTGSAKPMSGSRPLSSR